MNIGDLIIIDDLEKFKKSVDSFHDKWSPPSAVSTMALAMATPRATAMEMVTPVTVMVVATERKTNKKYKLKYYGWNFKLLENKRLVGLIAEIIKEEHKDFDIFKISEPSGQVRYCRRFVIENAMK